MDKVTHNYICSLYKDCSYYKQLKRLQAENEELKQDLHEVENACCCFESENADLRKENERLKEENTAYKSSFIANLDRSLADRNLDLVEENERLKKECTLYDCGNKEWAIEYKKLEDNYTELIDRLDDISYDKSNYYQALQEIRDYCEEQNLKADYTACEVIRRIEEVIGAE